MGFAGLKNIFEICLQLQLEAWLGDVIMTLKYQVEVEDERKKKSETGKWISVMILFIMVT